MYISPHKEGVGDHRLHVHDFDVGSLLETTYYQAIRLASRMLCCRVEWTVKNKKLLHELAIHHRLFENIEYLHRHYSHLLGWEFQFLAPISGTPIGNRISIPFLILDIPVGFFFETPMSGKSESWNSDLQNLEFRYFVCAGTHYVSSLLICIDSKMI